MNYQKRFSPEQAQEVLAELDRQGFKAGEKFEVTFFDDGRICTVVVASSNVRPWGAEIYTA